MTQFDCESLEIRRTLRNYSTCTEQHRKRMQQQRRQILAGSEQTSLLAQADPTLYITLVQRHGQQLVHQAERTGAIHRMDDCWADHLQMCSEVRSGIYLASLGGLNALDEFNRQVNASFRGYHQRVSEKVANSFRQARISDEGIDLEPEPLVGPSSTWTNMINDNPMGEIIDRLTRGLKRAARRIMTDK